MSNTDSVLELRVYMEDGSVTKFVQNNPAIAKEILQAVHPDRLFSAPQLLIGTGQTLTAFQPRLIVRLDVITDLTPDWLTPSQPLNMREITEEDFKTRCQPNRDVQRLPTQEIVVFGVWEMLNGERIFLQGQMTGFEEKRLPVEMSTILQNAMTSGGLLVRGRDVGYIILNRTSLARLTMQLGLQVLPANALLMRRLPD